MGSFLAGLEAILSSLPCHGNSAEMHPTYISPNGIVPFKEDEDPLIVQKLITMATPSNDSLPLAGIRVLELAGLAPGMFVLRHFHFLC